MRITPRKAVVATIVATTVVGAGILLTDLRDSDRTTGPAPTGIASVAPIRADTVPAALLAAAPASPVMALTTPAGKDWWDYTTKFAPDLRLSKVNLDAAQILTRGYAYVMAVPKNEDMADALPLFGSVLISAPSAKDANALNDWVAKQPGHEYRRAYVAGDTLVLAPEWSDGADYTLAVPADTARKAATAGRLEFHPGAWSAALVKHTMEPTKATVTSGLITAVGVTPTSAFAVSAHTPAGPWTGTAESMDPTKVNPGMINAIIENSAPIGPEKPAKAKPSGVDIETQLLDSNLTRIGSEGRWATFSDGKPTIEGDTVKPLVAPAAAGATAFGTYPLHRLANYAHGDTMERTGPRLLDVQFDSTGKAIAQPRF